MIAHSTGQFAAGRSEGPGLQAPSPSVKRRIDMAREAQEHPDAQPRSPFYAQSEGGLTAAISETMREDDPDMPPPETPITVRSTQKRPIPAALVPSSNVNQPKKKKKEVKDALFWKLLGELVSASLKLHVRIRRQCVINKHARHPETLKLWKTEEGRTFPIAAVNNRNKTNMQGRN